MVAKLRVVVGRLLVGREHGRLAAFVDWRLPAANPARSSPSTMGGRTTACTVRRSSKYTDPLADGTARQFSFVFDARSIITAPAWSDVVEPGWIELRGIAWSGRGAIARVEVSTDGGRTWQEARLQGPVLRQAHTRFRHLWRWEGAETEIMSRDVDDTDYVQPTRAALRAERGGGRGGTT